MVDYLKIHNQYMSKFYAMNNIIIFCKILINSSYLGSMNDLLVCYIFGMDFYVIKKVKVCKHLCSYF